MPHFIFMCAIQREMQQRLGWAYVATAPAEGMVPVRNPTQA